MMIDTWIHQSAHTSASSKEHINEMLILSFKGPLQHFDCLLFLMKQCYAVVQ